MTDTTPSVDPITSLHDPMGPGQTDRELPVGVHPLDRSVPTGGAYVFGTDLPASAGDGSNDYTRTARPPFGTANRDALGIFQRGDEEWSERLVVVNATQGGTAKALGRQRGRTSVTLFVPAQVWVGGALTTTPAGVFIGPTEGEVQDIVASVALNPGDSVTLGTEGPVWLGLLPNQTVGYCYVLATFNPQEPSP